MSSPIIKNLFLAFGSVVVTALLLEFSLRMFLPQPVETFYFDRDPIPGTAFLRWGGIEVVHNRHGDRDEDYPAAKPQGEFRIAAIGDSVTYGFGVEIGQSYGKVLQAHLNRETGKDSRFRVMNFSNGGNELDGYLETMRRKAPGFSPDLYLVNITLNDFVPTGERKKKTFRETYYDMFRDIHAFARIHSHLYYATMERARALLYRAKILDKSARRNLEMQLVETRGSLFENAWANSKPILAEIRAEAKRQNVPLVFVMFPYEFQLSKELLDIYRDAYKLELSDAVLGALPQQLVHRFFAPTGQKILDLTELYRAQAKSEVLFFREIGGALDWVHPNANGHKLAGDALFESLVCGSVYPSHIADGFPSEICTRPSVSRVTLHPNGAAG